MGALSSSVTAALSDHIVGDGILLPGVGYLELALESTKKANQMALVDVAFLRPCLLPEPRLNHCVV